MPGQTSPLHNRTFDAYIRCMSREEVSGIISSDPEVQGGAPVFRGTRVPVQSLFDHLEAGESIDEFLEGFSTVKRAQVVALLELCRSDALAGAH